MSDEVVDRDNSGHSGLTEDVASQMPHGPAALLEILLVALRLGLTSFGGPIAHLGYFKTEYVDRRRWLDAAVFADLVAIAQSLPGAASSKLGISIGILRGGLVGGIAAWIGFTLPSALALIAFAIGSQALGSEADGWIHGLQVVAVAVVALAVWSMARSLTPDRQRATIAIIAAVISLAVPTTVTTVTLIVVGGVVGWRLLGSDGEGAGVAVHVRISRRTGLIAGSLFVGLLVGLPLARSAVDSQPIALFDSFYRVGALVFGGGNLVLPLLQPEVVPPGWVTNDQFLAGYGAAQAVPGPLFTFAAFIGAAAVPEPNGLAGGTLAILAIFLPSFLLTVAALPWWSELRARQDVRAILRGVNATVVGVLLAALYHPVATNALREPRDAALALASFGLLAIWKMPPWIVVVATAAGGALLEAIA